MSRLRELEQVQLRWPVRSWPVQTERTYEEQEEEQEEEVEEGSAQSGAGTDQAPLRVGGPVPPLLGSATQNI